MHPSTAAILRHFRYEHLPPNLQRVSQPFCELAHRLAETLPGDPELTVLRHLLEARDCAVRAVRYFPPEIASYLDDAIRESLLGETLPEDSS